ncbi:MAG: hypothetical protein ACR2MP_28000 [Streptosporangiaceae bacterium]
MLGYCDNTTGALAGMLRPGSAGSNTTADHLQVLGDAITAVPAKHRRWLMVTADGAGASHGLIEHLDELAARPGHQLIYSAGWELGERERAPCTASRGRPGRSRSMAAARPGNAALMTPARTAAARMPAAGDKKRRWPS